MMYVITKDIDVMDAVPEVMGVYLHRQAAEVAYVEHVHGALREDEGCDWTMALHVCQHGCVHPEKGLIQVDGMRDGKRLHKVCEEREGIAV